MANNMLKFQESMKKLRENPDTSRAGLKWDDSEDENVLSKLKSGMSVDDIAKNLKRTANSIKTRIIMNAVAQIEEDSKNKAKVMKELKVTEADITEYKEKKQQRDDQQKNFINTMISKNIYNPTIRDNYQLLKEIINRLTAIEEKLDKDFPEKLVLEGLKKNDLSHYNSHDYVGITKSAIDYSDAIIIGESEIDKEIEKYIATLDKPVLPFYEIEEMADKYNELYNSLLKIKE